MPMPQNSKCIWWNELDCEESWALKNWCFWTVVLEKTLESPLDCKEIQPVLAKGDQSWVFTGRTDAKAETPVLWPPHPKSWLIAKDPDAGRDWGAGGEGDDRGWDGWMASLTRWTWVWVKSGSWWWTGRSGVLQSTGLQTVGYNWATGLNWTERVMNTKSKTETHWSQKRFGTIHELMTLFILSFVHSASIQIWVPNTVLH